VDLFEARRLEAAGKLPPLLLFWSHKGIGPGPWMLSQWYPAPFEIDGIRYATAEHWMMAGKARLFGDDTALEKVLATDDPAEAKEVGRAVRDFDGKKWAAAAADLVLAGSIAKFSSTEELRWYLVGTAPRVLVEASPTDAIWGVGLNAADRNVWKPTCWPGTNLG